MESKFHNLFMLPSIPYEIAGSGQQLASGAEVLLTGNLLFLPLRFLLHYLSLAIYYLLFHTFRYTTQNLFT